VHCCLFIDALAIIAQCVTIVTISITAQNQRTQFIPFLSIDARSRWQLCELNRNKIYTPQHSTPLALQRVRPFDGVHEPVLCVVICLGRKRLFSETNAEIARENMRGDCTWSLQDSVIGGGGLGVKHS
jgi:hypothetical protein